MNISFNFSWVNAQECNCLIMLGCVFSFVNKKLPEWLYHFTFSPAVSECFSCSPSLSTLGIVILFSFNIFDRCVMAHVVLICISWKANAVGHGFMCGLVCIFLHVSFVTKSLAHFFLVIVLSKFIIYAYKNPFYTLFRPIDLSFH